MTKKLLNTYKTFDVVVVHFPFTEKNGGKNRPVVILSSEKIFNNLSGHVLCTMITSTKKTMWPLDISIQNLKSCGLLKSSIIRLKLFTLDSRLIYKKIGSLKQKDQIALKKNVALLLNNVFV